MPTLTLRNVRCFADSGPARLAPLTVLVGENSTGIRGFLNELVRSGGAKVYKNEDVQQEADLVNRSGHCKSNDTHVIALARVSGSRVLYSRDKKLHVDFKNKDLLDHPRGSVYTSRRHINILTNSAMCKTP